MALRKFIFQASSDSEASTSAAQETIAIARRLGLPPGLVRAVSTRRVEGNRYETTMSLPDEPVGNPNQAPPAKIGAILGPVLLSPPVPRLVPKRAKRAGRKEAGDQ